MKAIQNPLSEIQTILYMELEPDHQGRCSTPPGHVLHYLIEGHYRLSINKHAYEAQAGDFIMYHGVEDVVWLENKETISFYSFVFKAPDLIISPYSQRVVQAQGTYQKSCENAFNYFHNNEHDLAVIALLQQMLADFYRNQQTVNAHEERNAWTQLEHRLRQKRLFRPRIQDCSELSGLSSASLNRHCHQLHHCSPMQRLAFIRMQQAKSLLQYSTLSISQIANELSYPRVHEFSREFSQSEHCSPSDYRKQFTQH